MSKKHYIVYDGRANYGTDQASIIGYFGEMSEQKALRYFQREYKYMDACLFSYDAKGDELSNEIRIA